MDSRTSRAIALRPSGNKQGGHYFLSLHTGKRILRNNWTTLPMPNDVVDAIHRLAESSRQAGGITFTDRDGNILTDDDEDETEEAEDNEPIPVVDDVRTMDENHITNTHNNNEEIIHEQQECMKVNKMMTIQIVTTHQNIIMKAHTITHRQHKRMKKMNQMNT